MTAIAWDGRMLAVDSLSVSNHNFRNYEKKLYDFLIGTNKCYFAGSGCRQDIYAVYLWLESQASLPVDIRTAPKVDSEFCGIFLVVPHDSKAVEVYKIEEHLTPFPVSGRVGIGSGGDFALALMSVGHTAEEAVGAACESLIDCGVPVNSVIPIAEDDIPF